MQIVSIGDMHEYQILFSGKNRKKYIINLSTAELARREGKFKYIRIHYEKKLNK